ncbi:MAG: hypothetical protein EHM45_04080 [Desulfobacteraceae bacterium]|nr:MAG: hypothetical protein EHM45_04080 [Desulfobacteraceae bacterium]
MKESEWIQLIAAGCNRDPRQINRLFECDAEILDLNGQMWALTLDQFSPEEDLFTSEEPEKLGANLATATLSDLLAAGAKPEFFMQGLTLPQGVDELFVRQLTGGISGVLAEVGCSLCGGDMGTADQWRFSGFCMGRVLNNKPLSRIMPKQPQTLWATGKFGDANFAALHNKATPRFELRYKEAQVIYQWATACMDTSGGLMDALWWLHMLNPDMRFEIDLDQVPLAPEVRKAACSGLPAEAFLLGGAGEYELIFMVAEPLGSTGQEALEAMSAIRIGEIHDRSSGLFFRKRGKVVSEMKSAPPCPREEANREKYIQAVIGMANELFGENKVT